MTKTERQKRNEQIQTRYANGDPVEQIASDFDLHPVYIRQLCAGIKRPPTPIGCSECNNPYARGMCKRCHRNSLRRHGSRLYRKVEASYRGILPRSPYAKIWMLELECGHITWRYRHAFPNPPVRVKCKECEKDE